MAMNKKIKKKWLSMLRSGRYKQTNGALAKKGSTGKYNYCCLGVLCRAVDAKPHYPSDARNPMGFVWHGEHQLGELEDNLREFVGLSNSDMQILVKMNDELGKEFFEIADYVELEL